MTAAWDVEWTSDELVVAGDKAAAWAGSTLAAWLADGEAPDAVYVATPDGGAREALAFWRAAHDTGFAFAAPAAFPWTLANSPTGRISLDLGVRGPCHTFVGGDEAVDEARRTAEDDLALGLVGRPLVVWLRGDRPVDADGSPARLLLSAALL